jgi:DNA topoisomerase IA
VPNVNDDLERRLPRLSDDKKRLFALICRSYLAAMMPDFEYRQTVVTPQVPVPRGKEAKFRTRPLQLKSRASAGRHRYLPDSVNPASSAEIPPARR